MNRKEFDNLPGMSFKDIRLIPGVVINNTDEENLGRIKAYSPGLFDTSTMDEDALPWIYPFCMSMYQSFSTQAVNSKIWIIFIPDNPYGYFYLPFHDIHTEVAKHIKGNTDIVFGRECNTGSANIYFNESEGLVLRNGNARVQLLNDGRVIITNDTSSGMNFVISDGKCYSGDKGFEPAVLGNKLKKVFDDLSEKINLLASKCNESPYTSHLTSSIQNIKSALDEDAKNILSTKCTVS